MEIGVRIEQFQGAVPGVRDRVFRRIRPVPGPARPIPTFSTVAAADRKWSPRADLGVSEGGIRLGDPQALPISRENTSGTWGTIADNYFRFAATTVESGRKGL